MARNMPVGGSGARSSGHRTGSHPSEGQFPSPRLRMDGKDFPIPWVLNAKEFGALVGIDQEQVSRMCAAEQIPAFGREYRRHWQIMSVPALRLFGLEVVAPVIAMGPVETTPPGGGPGPGRRASRSSTKPSASGEDGKPWQQDLFGA